MLLDGIDHAVGQDDGVFAADDLVQCHQLLRPDQRAGAVMDENMRDIPRERGECVHHRILPLASSADQDGGGGSVAGKLHHLPLVALHDDLIIGDAAGDEGRGRMGEYGPARERRENFVGHHSLHAVAAAGGVENGCGTAHESRKAKGARREAAVSFGFRRGWPGRRRPGPVL